MSSRALSREESILLLRELRIDGFIYFVPPEEPSARQDPNFVNKVTYTPVEDYKNRSKKECT